MNVLRLSGISLRLGSRSVLSDVSMDLRAGQVSALIGSNGSGKTTLQRVAVGLVRPTAGVVDRTGMPPNGRISVSFGPRLFHPGRSARTELAVRILGSGGTRADAAAAWSSTLLRDARIRCGALSLGQAQRLSLAAAFALPTSLLVLDEPTVGLDELGVEWLISRIRLARAGGTCVWVSSHDQDVLTEVCTTVAVIENGRLAEPAVPGQRFDDTTLRLRSPTTQALLRSLNAAEATAWLGDGGAVFVAGSSALAIGRRLARDGVPLTEMVTLTSRHGAAGAAGAAGTCGAGAEARAI